MDGFDALNQPKHALLREWLRQRINDGEYAAGQRIPSENELSARFGVSRQTVRQAIGALEMEGVLVRRRGSGTFVGENEAAEKPRTMTIGVVTPYLNDYIFPAIIQGIDDVLSGAGYHMSLSITHNQPEQERAVLASFLESGMDGLIIEPAKSASPNANVPLYRRLEQAGIPWLFINSYYADMGAGYVAMDDFAAGKLVTEYLLRRGHTEIGGIFKSDDMQGHLRYAGYMQAMNDAGLQVNDREVSWYATEDLPELWRDERDRYLLRRVGTCSAVVCYNDQAAVQMEGLLHRCGRRVPDDVSIVSFDNSELAAMGRGFTSVNHPKEALGEAAANRILRRIELPDFQPNLLMTPVLVERGSVRDWP